MPPLGESYNVDWIASPDSNVHVANHRDWFTSFTPFKTYFYAAPYDYVPVEVLGIGTVQLNVKLRKEDKFLRTNSHTITIYNVLYAPGFVCNVFSESTRSHDFFKFHYNPSGSCETLVRMNGVHAGVIENLLFPVYFFMARLEKCQVLNARIVNISRPAGQPLRTFAGFAIRKIKEITP